MANVWCPTGLEQLASGTVVWVTDTIKARLVSSLPASTVSVMTGITGIGDDQELASKSVVRDDTLASVAFVADNPSFPTLAAGSTAVGAVVFAFGTDDSDSVPLLMGSISAIPTNGGAIGLTWPTVAGTAGVVGYWHESADRHVAFTWSSVAGASSYVLKIGSTSGVYDVYDADVGNVLTQTVALLPSTYYSVVVPSTTAEQTVEVV
jgi:hypothetical protein